MTTNESVPPNQTNRRRWWIHLILVGGYILPTILVSPWYVPRQPALTNNVRGLLLSAAIEIALFSIFFVLGWLASRASREQHSAGDQVGLQSRLEWATASQFVLRCSSPSP